MADQKLDALVYPTKTVPAPLLAAPVEPTNIKVIKDTVTVTIDGETYERTVDRVIEVRPPLTWRLSPNGGFPTIAVPAGFTREVYDRAIVRGRRWRQDCRRSDGPQSRRAAGVDRLSRPSVQRADARSGSQPPTSGRRGIAGRRRNFRS